MGVSDRALRYRANAHPPHGPRRCCFCGVSTGAIDVGHVDGHEEHNEPENLIWICRSDNVRSANILRAAGLGRTTRQFNAASSGAKSLGAWLAAVMTLRGESNQMTVPAAIDLIKQTPPERRSRFAQEIWERRRARYGSSGRSDVPF